MVIHVSFLILLSCRRDVWLSSKLDTVEICVLLSAHAVHPDCGARHDCPHLGSGSSARSCAGFSRGLTRASRSAFQSPQCTTATSAPERRGFVPGPSRFVSWLGRQLGSTDGRETLT